MGTTTSAGGNEAVLAPSDDKGSYPKAGITDQAPDTQQQDADGRQGELASHSERSVTETGTEEKRIDPQPVVVSPTREPTAATPQSAPEPPSPRETLKGKPAGTAVSGQVVSGSPRKGGEVAVRPPTQSLSISSTPPRLPKQPSKAADVPADQSASGSVGTEAEIRSTIPPVPSRRAQPNIPIGPQWLPTAPPSRYLPGPYPYPPAFGRGSFGPYGPTSVHPPNPYGGPLYPGWFGR